MPYEGFTSQHRVTGRAAAWGAAFVLLLYIPTTLLGFLSLKSPQDPIGDPHVTIMELLIILVAPLMVVSMVAVHAYAPADTKVYSFTALAFAVVLAGITSCVHFVILSVGRQLEATGQSWVPLLLSFRWPSVFYTLDILAWDWFYALSVLCAVPVFRGGGLERALRIVLIVSGVLSLAGLIGVPLGDMQIRNIGIVGYAVMSPVVFLLLGLVFGRTRNAPQSVPAPQSST